MYAYSIRTIGNPELYKAIDKRIENYIDSGEVFDYPTLSNMIYYMMFRNNTNSKIWDAIIESTLAQDETLPIVYYKPFKYSRFFLKAHFKDKDISEYVDKFYYAD